MADEIKTQFVNPPIPFRGCDWVAWYDGDEEGFYGQGPTEAAAIDSLKQQDPRTPEDQRADARPAEVETEREAADALDASLEGMGDGGPAFPLPSTERFNAHEGMTLRDYFAGQAIIGILSGVADRARDGTPNQSYLSAAQDAYEYADAMLAARERPIQVGVDLSKV